MSGNDGSHRKPDLNLACTEQSKHNKWRLIKLAICFIKRWNYIRKQDWQKFNKVRFIFKRIDWFYSENVYSNVWFMAVKLVLHFYVDDHKEWLEQRRAINAPKPSEILSSWAHTQLILPHISPSDILLFYNQMNPSVKYIDWIWFWLFHFVIWCIFGLHEEAGLISHYYYYYHCYYCYWCRFSLLATIQIFGCCDENDNAFHCQTYAFQYGYFRFGCFLTEWNLWQNKYTIIDCVLKEILWP